MSYSTICCQNLLLPFSSNNPPASWACCNLLTPFIPTSVGSGAPITCSQVACDAYTPVCFSVSSSSLCSYLQGIDVSICTLQTSLSNITCSQITMTGAYSCMYPPTVADTGMSLCDWALQVNSLFCGVFASLQGSGSSIASTPVTNSNSVLNNMVVDGANGTLTTTTGISAINGTLSTTNVNTHGIAPQNVTISSSDPLNSASLKTNSNIFVEANKIYAVKAFVYLGASMPPTSTLSITINGTGASKVIQSVDSSTQTGWQQVVTHFVPSSNQNITITIGGTGFTSGVLTFADLTMQHVPAVNSGGYLEFQIPYIDDIGQTYNNIASNFAASLAYSASGLVVSLGADILVMYGKTIYTTAQNLTLTANTTTYVYYDSWTDTYIQKTTNVTDATQVLLYTLVTDSGSVTSKTTDVARAPFGATSIQDGSITGAKIASATIASSNLVNTAVTPGSYGDSTNATHIPYITVNAQGQITGASNVAINFPVISVNGKTGAASLGLGDLNNVVLTSPSSGQFLTYNGTDWVNSSTLVAYYQKMYANGVAQTQRSFLNFSSAFALSDSSVNNWTFVQIASNGVNYGMLQQSSGGNVLLGNSTGSTGNYSEQTVNNSLLLSGGQLSVNNVANVQTGASYNLTAADCNGQTVVGFTDTSVSSVSAVLPAAGSVVAGSIVRIKDLGGNASVHNITVTVSGGANIDGSASAVINTNYGKATFVMAVVSTVAGWYSI